MKLPIIERRMKMVLKLVMVARRLKIIMKPPPIERKLKTILKLVMHDGGEEIENDELADDTKEEENYSERCDYNV